MLQVPRRSEEGRAGLKNSQGLYLEMATNELTRDQQVQRTVMGFAGFHEQRVSVNWHASVIASLIESSPWFHEMDAVPSIKLLTYSGTSVKSCLDRVF